LCRPKTIKGFRNEGELYFF